MPHRPPRWPLPSTPTSVIDRDDSAASVERLGGAIVGTEDSEWTKTVTVRDPQGAEFVLSQFSPPKG